MKADLGVNAEEDSGVNAEVASEEVDSERVDLAVAKQFLDLKSKPN